jgi:hypothetical protein
VSTLKGEKSKSVSLENEFISISIDSTNGVLRQIYNKKRDLSLVMGDIFNSRPVPWRLGILEENWIGRKGVFDLKTAWIDKFESFSFCRKDEASIDLVWDVNSTTRVEARIDVPRGDPNSYFYVKLKHEGKEKIAMVEYPVIQGIGALGNDPEKNYLAHPHASGVLFHNPLELFRSVGKRPISFMLQADQGLPFSIYPEGYAGSAMQFMVYYLEDVGGFYMACHDGEANLKAINFYKNSDDLLEASFVHIKPDFNESDFKVDYPVVIGSLFRGDWYEGAERYKEWATHQFWCKKGPLWKRVEEGTASKWLIEEVGFCTFGINSRYDRSPWLKFFHDIINKPVFHILGVNWPKIEVNYMGRMASAAETWFPATFHPENIKTIKENGDYFAPFEFDIIVGSLEAWPIVGSPEAWPEERINKIRESLLVVPRQVGYGIYSHGYLCPFTSFLRDLHVWRDKKLIKEYDADANYYDVSFSNVLMACFSNRHGHPIGGGKWMIEAWRKLATETKEETSRAKGSYVPKGTEVIIEPLIGDLDFYQARANGSPCAPMEIDLWREWIKQGKVEKIPMFDFVYHEYGPVRLDGWAKISHEIGDLFYWMVGRTALWGGIIELNYEFSPLEVIDGQYENVKEHYYRMADRRYAVDPNKIEFIREVSDARTRFAKDYLAYGIMVKPLKIASRKTELNWFSYNSPIGEESYEDEGSLAVSGILHSAWRFKNNLGFIFLNLQNNHDKVKVNINISKYYGIEEPELKAYIATRERKIFLGVFKEKNLEFEIGLPPRKIVLLELKRERTE